MQLKSIVYYILFLISLTAYSSEYYLIGKYSNPELAINYSQKTHLIIVGSAKKEDSDQFFQSGVTRALRYQELFPLEQIIIISTPDVKRKSNTEVFNQFNVTIKKIVHTRLTGKQLLYELRKFTKIASIDFYGHSSPWALILGKKKAFLGPGTGRQAITSLRGHFTKLAYATLNSCNSGFKLAPALSQAWQIPVSGALTSSLFERTTINALWENEFISDHANWTVRNNISFLTSPPCREGTCWRMKPEPSIYQGHWGNFDHGLSFYKFFCNYPTTDEKCAAAIAFSLFSFPSITPLSLDSTKEDFKKNLIDYMCPTGKGINLFQQCKQMLTQQNINQYYSPLGKKQLSCSHKKCQFKLTCKYHNNNPVADSCKITTNKQASTTFIDSFLIFLKGYDILKSQFDL